MADICEHAGYADRLLPADSFEDSWYRGRQASRSRQERLRAFLDSPIRLRAGVRLDGAHIVVADDVLSTGATAHALARALRSAGAIVDTGIFLSSGAYPARHAHDSGI